MLRCCSLDDPAKKYFSPKVSDRERAAFEAGIALGMVLHQFRGIPIKFKEEVELIKKLIAYAVLSQPFKKHAEVDVLVELPEGGDPYRYATLKTRDIDVRVVVEYGRAVVKARARYVPELDYTLAYIEEIQEKE
uniref:Dihydroneopterin aldolase n=1 Tax=Ignisphaera aggregans TaxID=334771 RepID=A0A7C4NM84_9CREN